MLVSEARATQHIIPVVVVQAIDLAISPAVVLIVALVCRAGRLAVQ